MFNLVKSAETLLSAQDVFRHNTERRSFTFWQRSQDIQYITVVVVCFGPWTLPRVTYMWHWWSNEAAAAAAMMCFFFATQPNYKKPLSVQFKNIWLSLSLSSSSQWERSTVRRVNAAFGASTTTVPGSRTAWERGTTAGSSSTWWCSCSLCCGLFTSLCTSAERRTL